MYVYMCLYTCVFTGSVAVRERHWCIDLFFRKSCFNDVDSASLFLSFLMPPFLYFSICQSISRGSNLFVFICLRIRLARYISLVGFNVTRSTPTYLESYEAPTVSITYNILFFLPLVVHDWSLFRCFIHLILHHRRCYYVCFCSKCVIFIIVYFNNCALGW